MQEMLENTYFNNSLWQYLLFMGSVVVAIIVARIIYYIFKTKLRKLADQSNAKFDNYLIDIIEEPIAVFTVAIGIWGGAKFLTLNDIALKFFDNIVHVLFAFTVTWLIIRLIDMLVTVYVEPIVGDSHSKLDDQILPILKKSAKTIVLILAVIIVFSNLGYDVISILAGLGVGGLALALAAQDAVKHIIGGITIFWDKPFQIGDWIEVGGQSGSVAEVGLRSTRLKTVGNTTVVLPNSDVANSTLENFSTRKARRMIVMIGLTYETTADQMDEAIKIVEETIKSIEGTNHEDIMIRFVNFGAFSLDLEIVYWITDMSNWKPIIHQVNMGIKRNLDAAKIDMAFPTETHYVINQK